MSFYIDNQPFNKELTIFGWVQQFMNVLCQLTFLAVTIVINN